jgi:chaperonin GroES|tara:strand:- start:137 stop:439 length:303 start_codon:yes stop_codon:yes gene_type:complete
MATIKAVNGHAVLKVIEYEEQLAGNIIIPDMGDEKPEVAEVVDLGPMYNFQQGEYCNPVHVEVGDKVFIPKMGASKVTLGTEEYLICRATDILGILKEDK